MPSDGLTFEDIIAELMDDADFASLFDALPPLPPMPPRRSGYQRLEESQLRVLRRKHLLMLLQDLEAELRRVKEEKANMLLAYRAGLRQRP